MFSWVDLLTARLLSILGTTIKVTVVFVLFLTFIACSSLVLMAPYSAASYDLPPVYIANDGAVVGTSNIARNGNLYTLTGNVVGSIIVQKDDLTIDGAGFTVQGDSRGIVLENRTNVTVQNTRVTAWGGYTLELRNAKNCTITQNVIVGLPENAPPPPGDSPLRGPTAIHLLNAQNITITYNNITQFSSALSLQWATGGTIIGNNLSDGLFGIEFTNATGFLFQNNRMTNCTGGIYIQTYISYRYENDLDPSNTVDGKPIVYWQNRVGGIISTEAAYIVLVNCSNVLVQNVSPGGLLLGYSTNCTISNIMTTSRSSGIALENCTKVNVVNCTFQQQALLLEGSFDNQISGCTFINSNRGIGLDASGNNTIIYNTFTGNGHDYAIRPSGDYYSSGNLIMGNIFSGSDYALTARGIMHIVNNTFVGNNVAVLCYTGANVIADNTFINNGRGVVLQSTDNILRSNQFINNTDNLPIVASYFNNDVDASNNLNGKPMYYWINQHNRTVPLGAGFVVLINCTSILAQNLTLTNQANGVHLVYSTNCTFQGNLVANTTNGIYLYASQNNTFTENTLTNNGYAVFIHGATSIPFIGYTNYTSSSGNWFFRNNFADNNQTLYDVAAAYDIGGALPSVNTWDNGAQGNYWADQNGTDANNDGIYDSPYRINSYTVDNYPLVKAAVTQPLPSPTATVYAPSTVSSQTPSQTSDATSIASATPQPVSELNFSDLLGWIVAAFAVVLVVILALGFAKKKQRQ